MDAPEPVEPNNPLIATTLICSAVTLLALALTWGDDVTWIGLQFLRWFLSLQF